MYFFPLFDGVVTGPTSRGEVAQSTLSPCL